MEDRKQRLKDLETTLSKMMDSFEGIDDALEIMRSQVVKIQSWKGDIEDKMKTCEKGIKELTELRPVNLAEVVSTGTQSEYFLEPRTVASSSGADSLSSVSANPVTVQEELTSSSGCHDETVKGADSTFQSESDCYHGVVDEMPTLKKMTVEDTDRKMDTDDEAWSSSNEIFDSSPMRPSSVMAHKTRVIQEKLVAANAMLADVDEPGSPAKHYNFKKVRCLFCNMILSQRGNGRRHIFKCHFNVKQTCRTCKEVYYDEMESEESTCYFCTNPSSIEAKVRVPRDHHGRRVSASSEGGSDAERSRVSTPNRSPTRNWKNLDRSSNVKEIVPCSPVSAAKVKKALFKLGQDGHWHVNEESDVRLEEKDVKVKPFITANEPVERSELTKERIAAKGDQIGKRLTRRAKSIEDSLGRSSPAEDQLSNCSVYGDGDSVSSSTRQAFVDRVGRRSTRRRNMVITNGGIKLCNLPTGFDLNRAMSASILMSRIDPKQNESYLKAQRSLARAQSAAMEVVDKKNVSPVKKQEVPAVRSSKNTPVQSVTTAPSRGRGRPRGRPRGSLNQGPKRKLNLSHGPERKHQRSVLSQATLETETTVSVFASKSKVSKMNPVLHLLPGVQSNYDPPSPYTASNDTVYIQSGQEAYDGVLREQNQQSSCDPVTEAVLNELQHPLERRFICPTCGQRFETSAAVKIHEMGCVENSNSKTVPLGLAECSGSYAAPEFKAPDQDYYATHAENKDGIMVYRNYEGYNNGVAASNTEGRSHEFYPTFGPDHQPYLSPQPSLHYSTPASGSPYQNYAYISHATSPSSYDTGSLVANGSEFSQNSSISSAWPLYPVLNGSPITPSSVVLRK